MATSTVSAARSSDPVRDLDDLRPKPAKAGLASDRLGPRLTSTVKAAVLSHYGSVKAAAFSLGEGAKQPPLDPSLMMREFDAGKFGRLDHADEETKAAIAKALDETFGRTDPKARVRRLINDGRRILDEIAEAAL